MQELNTELNSSTTDEIFDIAQKKTIFNNSRMVMLKILMPMLKKLDYQVLQQK